MHASTGVGSPSPVVSAVAIVTDGHHRPLQQVKPDSTFWSLYPHHTVAASHISWHSDTDAVQQMTQLSTTEWILLC